VNEADCYRIHQNKLTIIRVTPLLPAKPDEPTGPFRFDEIDATTVTCSWDLPLRDGGAPISGYVVEQRDAHRPGWVPVCDSVSRPTFKFENLIEGDEYVFRAAATNRFGTGEFLQSEIVTCKSLKSKTFSFSSDYISNIIVQQNGNSLLPPQMCLDLPAVQSSLMYHVMA